MIARYVRWPTKKREQKNCCNFDGLIVLHWRFVYQLSVIEVSSFTLVTFNALHFSFKNLILRKIAETDISQDCFKLCFQMVLILQTAPTTVEIWRNFANHSYFGDIIKKGRKIIFFLRDVVPTASLSTRL